eukprot:TRINITY_DN18181_c0_g1_i1.p1 TRINITY_DN18181_c0_g1~~TRINITY_DN18181_c0_g1_i1.p1  ORF type:complete len:197 (+),score=49.74 TRINITY_DN18181_c0_g1_i1:230-820(+)
MALPNLLAVGGQGSGLSTLLEQIRAFGRGVLLPGRQMRKLYPTLGVDTGTTRLCGQQIRMVEVGGSMISHAHRHLVSNDVCGVIFTIDATQPRELPLVVIELYNMLQNPKLRSAHVPFLVVYTKVDSPSRMSAEMLAMAVGLHELPSEYDVESLEASGLTGSNIERIVDWMSRKTFKRGGGLPNGDFSLSGANPAQ